MRAERLTRSWSGLNTVERAPTQQAPRRCVRTTWFQIRSSPPPASRAAKALRAGAGRAMAMAAAGTAGVARRLACARRSGRLLAGPPLRPLGERKGDERSELFRGAAGSPLVARGTGSAAARRRRSAPGRSGAGGSRPPSATRAARRRAARRRRMPPSALSGYEQILAARAALRAEAERAAATEWRAAATEWRTAATEWRTAATPSEGRRSESTEQGREAPERLAAADGAGVHGPARSRRARRGADPGLDRAAGPPIGGRAGPPVQAPAAGRGAPMFAGEGRDDPAWDVANWPGMPSGDAASERRAAPDEAEQAPAVVGGVIAPADAEAEMGRPDAAEPVSVAEARRQGQTKRASSGRAVVARRG